MKPLRSYLFQCTGSPAYLEGDFDARRCPSLELTIYVPSGDWWQNMAVVFEGSPFSEPQTRRLLTFP